jgi:hypothetical protein
MLNNVVGINILEGKGRRAWADNAESVGSYKLCNVRSDVSIFLENPLHQRNGDVATICKGTG